MADGVVIFDVELNSAGLSSALSGLGSKLAKGAAIAAAGAAVGKAFSSAIGIGMNFESVMSKVEALSGATAAEMAQLTEAAKQWGESTAFSASEVGQAFTYMAQAGWQTGSMLEGIGPILNLAAADGLDLATTSDIVTDALTAFGLTAGDAAMFADTLAVAAAASNTNVQMMGETFKYVGPVAGALGYNVKDVSLAIGLMANAGIKGSQAGTSLRSMLTRLAKPTAQVKKAMNDLGISLSNSDGTMKSFSEVLGNMRESFAGLTAEQKAQYAAMIAGQEGMSGLLAIVNASEDDFNKLAAAIENSNGAAESMAKTMMDNLAGDIEEFKGAAETLAIEFYETFSDSLRTAVQTGTSIVQKLTSGLKEGDLAGAFMDIFENDFPKIAGDIGTKLGEALGGLPELLETGGETTNSLFEGLLKSTQALAKGITEGIGQSLPEFLPSLAASIVKGLGTAFSSLPEYADAATNLVSGLAETLVGVDGSEVATSLSGLASDIAAGLGKSFENIPALADAAKTLMSGITNALKATDESGAVASITELGTVIGEGLGAAFAELPSLLETGGETASALLQGVLVGAEGLAKGLVKGIEDNLPGQLSSLASGLVSGLATALSTSSDFVLAAKNLIVGISDAFTTAAEDGGEIKEPITRLAKAIGEGLGTAIASLPELIVAGAKIIDALLVGVGAAIEGLVTGIWDGLVNGLKNKKFESLGDLVTKELLLGKQEDLQNEIAQITQLAEAYQLLAEATSSMAEDTRNPLAAFLLGASDQAPDLSTLQAGLDLLTQYRELAGDSALTEKGIDLSSLLGLDGATVSAEAIQGNVDAIVALGIALQAINSIASEGAGDQAESLREKMLLLEEVNKRLAEFPEDAGEKAQEGAEAVAEGMESISDALSGTGEGETAETAAVVEQAQTIMQETQTAVQEGKTAIEEEMAGLAATLTEAINTALTAKSESGDTTAQEKLRLMGVAMAEAVALGLTEGAEGVKTALMALFAPPTEESAETMAVNAASWVQKLREAISAAVSGGVEGGGEAGGAEGDADTMQGFGLSLIQAVADGVRSGAGKVKTELMAAVAAAKNAINLDQFNTLGQQISQGIADGITAGSGAIATALVNAVLMALGEAKGVLGIASPSRVFRDEVGRWIPAGAAQGVKMEAWQLRQAAREMVLGSIPDMRNLSKRVAGSMHFGWQDMRIARRAAMAGYQPIQEVNFNVPVQTPDEFAQTVELFMTYGLEADY